jgi:hypothetical protein
MLCLIGNARPRAVVSRFLCSGKPRKRFIYRSPATAQCVTTPLLRWMAHRSVTSGVLARNITGKIEFFVHG